MKPDSPSSSVSTPLARKGERGSALILATLITVIMSLLGISYLMMAETENTIAENERNAMLALYVAESGARLAVTWFNDPTSTGYLVPGSGDVDLTKRVLDHDNNPATARVLAVAGDGTKPLYKDSAISTSSLFNRPYRSALAETFLGIETGTDPNPSFANAGPDLIVKDTHLAAINNTLFPNFPSAGLRARVARIEIYSPPIVDIGGTPTRMGLATIKVTGGVFIYPDTPDERQIASRVVKAVINEIPVPGPAGPLQSCADLNYNGSFEINWGTATAAGDADVSSNLDGKLDTGLPYAPNDPLNYINSPNTLVDWALDPAINGDDLEDPWYKFISTGAIDEAPNTDVQPWPHTYPGTVNLDHSNMFQFYPTTCPTMDYTLWKAIAQSGFRNHYYYTWSSGFQYKLEGQGTAEDFETFMPGKKGVIFLDTMDGSVPNGLPYTHPGSNLTPDIAISGGGWGVQGMLYMNTKIFRSSGIGGVLRTVFPPGEPSDASGFVNLEYPSALDDPFTIRQGVATPQQVTIDGVTYCTDYTVCPTTPSAVPVQDDVGLPFQADITIDGVFYTSGAFEVQGNDNFYGAVIAQQGVIDGGGTPSFYFDESLIKGDWPRANMKIPRVIVSSWQTDL